MFLLIVINTFILFSLSALHFYWAFGGRWCWESALPTKSDGRFLFKPGLGSTLVVAFGLLAFAVIISGNYGLLGHWIERKYIHLGIWFIAAIFLVRAVGDFRYIGFTKKFKGSKFAVNDTKIYSPLCLGIALLSFFIA